MILVFYIYGILTIYLEIFPFKQLQYVKQYVLKTNVHKAVRETNITSLISIPTETIKEPLIFVTYGQSNSVNSGKLGYEPSEDVYMFLDGKTYRYHDPALGGTGGHGSVWGRVGDQLIQNNVTSSVGFVTTGSGGASIHALTYGDEYMFFEKQFRSVLEEFGRVDGILFHQGEANHQSGKGSGEYSNDFLTLLTNIRNLSDAPVYLSQASLCHSKPDELLLEIQDKLIKNYKGVLRGPNSDLLSDPKFRLPDHCHFSSAGLDELSRMWFESIVDKSEM